MNPKAKTLVLTVTTVPQASFDEWEIPLDNAELHSILQDLAELVEKHNGRRTTNDEEIAL